MQLTDREILEACARAYGIEGDNYATRPSCQPSNMPDEWYYWNPLEEDDDCARMENKCGVMAECAGGCSFCGDYMERFTPGNDAERRRASCLVVARTQLSKEKQHDTA